MGSSDINGSSPAAPAKLQLQLTKLVTLAAFGIGAGVAICAVMGLFGRLGFPVELSTHFYFQYLVVLFACLLVLAGLRRFKAVLALSPFFCIALAKVAPLYVPDGSPALASAGTLKIAQSNVHVENRNYKAVINYANSLNADVIGFEEVDTPWVTALREGLKTTYPYAVVAHREDPFGIALFSKTPLKNARLYEFGGVQLPTIVAQLDVGGKPVTLVHTHPLPPSFKPYHDMRNKELRGIAQQRAVLGTRFIVFGDLNTSSWSPVFEDLVNGLGAHDSRKGFGLQFSWPTIRPLFFLSTTIDHFLTSPNIVTTKRVVGPSVGSDHYPVYAEMSIAD